MVIYTGTYHNLVWHRRSQVTESPEYKPIRYSNTQGSQVGTTKEFCDFEKKSYYIYGLTVSLYFIAQQSYLKFINMVQSLPPAVPLHEISGRKSGAVRDKKNDRKYPCHTNRSEYKTAKWRKMSFLTYDLFFGFKIGSIHVSFMASMIRPFIWDWRHEKTGHFLWKWPLETHSKIFWSAIFVEIRNKIIILFRYESGGLWLFTLASP